ncbi:MAG: PcfJ domain-containing protein [Thiohalocapsa sp.]|nr:PcfJ domain-containing protein [Thiohalocapsa sp.]
MPNDQPDARFKDDTLYVFKPHETQLIKAWPDLTAVRKQERGRRWLPFEPRYPLIRPYRSRRKKPDKAKDPPQLTLALEIPEQGAVPPPLPRLTPAQRRKRAFDRFRFACPKPVARRAEPFRSDHLRLLRLLHVLGDAGDLFDSNPALAYCLAVADDIGSLLGTDERAAARVAGWKQAEIMQQLGLPGTRQASRIMAKIRSASMSREVAVGLRASLRDQTALKLLAHLPELNAGTLALINDGALRERLTPKLLEAVLADPRETYFPFTARELEAVCHMAGVIGVDLGRRRFIEPARITALHDDLTRDYLRLKIQGLAGYSFPPPPVPGTDAIEPLATPKALIEEGRAQSNCVGGYARRVAEGNTYIYRVLSPQRATLSIVRVTGGDWQIGELLQACNVPVARATRQAVADWLETYSV